MKRLIFLLTAVLFFVTVNHAVAENNLSIAASKIESGISAALEIMGTDLEIAAKETGKLNADNESEIRKLLLGLYSKRPYIRCSIPLV
jgi:YbbR domain-containing protein